MRKYFYYNRLVLRYLYNLRFIAMSAEVRSARADENEQKCDSTWMTPISMFSSLQIEVATYKTNSNSNKSTTSMPFVNQSNPARRQSLITNYFGLNQGATIRRVLDNNNAIHMQYTDSNAAHTDPIIPFVLNPTSCQQVFNFNSNYDFNLNLTPKQLGIAPCIFGWPISSSTDSAFDIFVNGSSALRNFGVLLDLIY